MIDWKPATLVRPPKMIDAPTAWDEMEMGLYSIVTEFCESYSLALEFGVQHGYSTVAISNYFAHVKGVDTFVGDPYSGQHYDNFTEVRDSLKPYPNIHLEQCDWMDFAERNNGKMFDLIHVDIYHTYDETYHCGFWSLHHSPVVLFHDTISFPEVCRAVEDLAKETGRTFYHWQFRHGLGILV